MATHSSILAIHLAWMEEAGRLQSMGLQRVGHDRATSSPFLVHWFLECRRSVLPSLLWPLPICLDHGPNIPGSYAILLFTASDLASITSYIHSWVFFLLWLHPFVLSGYISPLISSSIFSTYRLGEIPLSVSYHFAFSCCSWGSQGKNTEVVCHFLLQ